MEASKGNRTGSPQAFPRRSGSGAETRQPLSLGGRRQEARLFAFSARRGTQRSRTVLPTPAISSRLWICARFDPREKGWETRCWSCPQIFTIRGPKGAALCASAAICTCFQETPRRSTPRGLHHCAKRWARAWPAGFQRAEATCRKGGGSRHAAFCPRTRILRWSRLPAAGRAGRRCRLQSLAANLLTT